MEEYADFCRATVHHSSTSVSRPCWVHYENRLGKPLGVKNLSLQRLASAILSSHYGTWGVAD